MAPLAKLVTAAAILTAPALAAAAPKLEIRQYQDPNSTLVIDEPSCDFIQCTIYWSPGQQVAVNWYNPPSQGNVQIDLMTNNNSQVAYTVGVAPPTSSTCDAGAGYGQPGPDGRQCGGFVFTVPSSWNAGNYTALRAMSTQDENLQSFTDKIYITHNSTTSDNAPFSIVSGSTVGGTSSTTASSSTGTPAAGTTTRSSASVAPTSSGASASRTSASTSNTSTGSTASPTTSGRPNGALSCSSSSAAAFSLAAASVVGLTILL